MQWLCVSPTLSHGLLAMLRSSFTDAVEPIIRNLDCPTAVNEATTTGQAAMILDGAGVKVSHTLKQITQTVAILL